MISFQSQMLKLYPYTIVSPPYNSRIRVNFNKNLFETMLLLEWKVISTVRYNKLYKIILINLSTGARIFPWLMIFRTN